MCVCIIKYIFEAVGPVKLKDKTEPVQFCDL